MEGGRQGQSRLEQKPGLSPENSILWKPGSEME